MNSSLRQQLPAAYTHPTGEIANGFLMQGYYHILLYGCGPSQITFQTTCHESTEPFSKQPRVIVNQHGSCSCERMPEIRYRACYSWSDAEPLPPHGNRALWFEESTTPSNGPGRIFASTDDLPLGYLGGRSFTEVWRPLVPVGGEGTQALSQQDRLPAPVADARSTQGALSQLGSQPLSDAASWSSRTGGNVTQPGGPELLSMTMGPTGHPPSGTTQDLATGTGRELIRCFTNVSQPYSPRAPQSGQPFSSVSSDDFHDTGPYVCELHSRGRQSSSHLAQYDAAVRELSHILDVKYFSLSV